MKQILMATVSASVLALSLPQQSLAQNANANINAQINANANAKGARDLADLLALAARADPARVTERLQQLSQACEDGGTLPNLPAGVDCAVVDLLLTDEALRAQVLENPEMIDQVIEQANIAPTPAEGAPVEDPAEVAEAPAAEAPADVAEAPAETAEPVESEDLAAALAEAEAKADAEAQAAADPAPVEPEAPEVIAAPQEEPAPQDPPQMDAQAQADAVAAQDDAPAAAAAADADAQAEVSEETVADADVRRSDQDFDTDVMAQAPANEPAADGGNGDDSLRDFKTAALIGLGAVALNEILNADDKVVSNSGDRVVVEDGNGQYRVLRNDDVLLRRPGAEVQTYSYDDGSTRTVITYNDGTTVETVRANDGRVLRRTRTLQDGTEVVLFDDTQAQQEVVVNDLPQTTDRNTVNYRTVEVDNLEAALAAQETAKIDRTFSLNQIRNIDAVRQLVPEISVDTINFATDSAAIRPDEAEELATLGNAMRDLIDKNPGEVFLIEGHTDAVGGYGYNLALSDRRAESVALALTEYFAVPPENMVLQGYGESDLLVQTQSDERANRRAAIRRITPLLQ
ncbi:OmpA family protein [Tropicibacter naphthalenivorans]|uniref:Flagellar motor protein MotB n=1 Tax=Tropicibacter naphthalenivorans TaxID=441103 RepID=A0A0P1G5Q8_9RHOB|nr:OmpA family protein [Tropicibacter naphthalenivorans]CUH77034.1 flagellar motor protein MotB [Tropicibacter naphthalenivorans]SMC61383.1 Outer membrane protein OmpA and related peptidoglycan-associated (lipo)proteins [Tropicibacter naphthalenivorans]